VYVGFLFLILSLHFSVVGFLVGLLLGHFLVLLGLLLGFDLFIWCVVFFSFVSSFLGLCYGSFGPSVSIGPVFTYIGWQLGDLVPSIPL